MKSRPTDPYRIPPDPAELNHRLVQGLAAPAALKSGEPKKTPVVRLESLGLERLEARAADPKTQLYNLQLDGTQDFTTGTQRTSRAIRAGLSHTLDNHRRRRQHWKRRHLPIFGRRREKIIPDRRRSSAMIQNTQQHPGADEIRAYGQGRLSPEAAAAVEQHIAECDHEHEHQERSHGHGGIELV